ncbi:MULTISPECIES: hypothetical protein [Comamonadaceae]|uniref:Secreted protein n=1 Tax=Alicycliphilus denitrificans (strain DSM 14773 / CIP 107495 / K601) TaxID=596154 RepID=F4G976_ALIDK|nr:MULTISPECIES: hypothetical protein [Comamonadaceae]AEB85666.1 hypothetical protein Alide2_3325 [Alicycliphilus denitrificans K601]
MKNVLCLLAIFFAYGLAGHLDYQDAVAMEEAMRQDDPPSCATPQFESTPARLARAEPHTPPAWRPEDHEGIEK